MEVKLHAEESGGALTAMEVTLPPGIATPLHVHHREAEAFYLLAGTLDYEAGGQLHRLATGSLIWLPKDVPHRFRVTGDAPARFLALGLPGGIEHLYQSVGIPADSRALPGAYPAEPELAPLAHRRARPRARGARPATAGIAPPRRKPARAAGGGLRACPHA